MEVLFIILLIFLSYPLFLVIRKILESCKIGTKLNQRNISMFSVIFLLPILYVGGIGIKLMIDEYSQRQEFNQEIWLLGEKGRSKMTNHIIDSKMLIGKSEKELIEILGNDHFRESENHLAYRIGFTQRIFGKHPYILNIYFNDEKVNNVSQNFDKYYW